jgi:hypothetical protein
VNVQVLSFGAGVHPAMDGSFSILGFPEATDPDVVYLENQAGRRTLTGPSWRSPRMRGGGSPAG